MGMHPVVYESQSFGELLKFLEERRYQKIFILVDENTEKYCLPILNPFIHSYEPVVIKIQSGEDHKILKTCQVIWNQFLAYNANRQSLLINLGGGVIGDMGGFAASVYKRGFHFINVPTTLLAAVDASVGGKTGIDYRSFKNHIGIFVDPQAVFVNPVFFESLEIRQLKSGFAEMIKHGLISNADYYDQLSEIQDFFNVDWPNYIDESVKIKSKIVDEDPNEKGIRKLLNFGHTAGHAFESFSMENHDIPLLHGEAVALGMMMELDLSAKKLGFDETEADKIKKYLQSVFSIRKFKQEDFEGLLNFMMQDKKNTNQGINFTLLKEIGAGVIDQFCSKKEIAECLQAFIDRD